MTSYNIYKMSLWVKYGISWWQIVYAEVIKSQNHPTYQYTRRMSNIYLLSTRTFGQFAFSLFCEKIIFTSLSIYIKIELKQGKVNV